MSAPDNEQLSDWTKEWLARIYGGPPRYYIGLKESWMRVPYWIYRIAQWVPTIDRKWTRFQP